MEMYDSAHALMHLRGKYIVLFGDSTLQENMYDLIILLSGISKDREALDAFMNRSIWLNGCASLALVLKDRHSVCMRYLKLATWPTAVATFTVP